MEHLFKKHIKICEYRNGVTMLCSLDTNKVFGVVHIRGNKTEYVPIDSFRPNKNELAEIQEIKKTKYGIND